MPKSIVMTFGRFNPPTTGHARLIALVLRTAIQQKAEAAVFVSESFDRETNPLPPMLKVSYLWQLFPGVKFAEAKNAFEAVHRVTQLGFSKITVVVGSDRRDEFLRIGENYKRWVKGQLGMKRLKLFDVVVVPTDRNRGTGVAGISATKLRKFAREDNWQAFRAGVPTKNETLARQIYDTVRRYLNDIEGSVQEAAPTSKPAPARVSALRDIAARVIARRARHHEPDATRRRDTRRRAEANATGSKPDGNARRVLCESDRGVKR